jgi:hypothetical protein
MSQKLKSMRGAQSRRVAAWIYAAINPIVDSLHRELSLLAVENLTWRSGSGRCEFIKPIQEYVDVRQWPNLIDFLADHPMFEKFFKAHDVDVQSLNARANDVYRWIVSSEQFSSKLAEILQTYESQRGTLGPQAPSFNNSRDDLVRTSAENIINNVPSLPSHYLFAPFWNFASNDLLAFRRHSEFQPLHSVRGKLIDFSSDLRAQLEQLRLSLSRKFDIPAAPVPGISFEE